MGKQDLTGAFTFEVTAPYLLYRTTDAAGNLETLAIWCGLTHEDGHLLLS